MNYPIPIKIFEQHAVALGKTGAGKSWAMRTIIEQLLDADKRVCIIDPKGDHFGIKLSPSGKSAGYPVMLFGDFKNPKASDLAINEKSGKEIGELIAIGNRPCVIGFRGWMPSQYHRFWIDFASVLFNKNETPLYLGIDEVHNFAPKGKIMSPEVGLCLHWTNRLGSEGRGMGIRIIMASQRPQKVHNDLLTCAETLIAMRVTHPSDREAFHEWLKEYADDNERGKMVLSSLATMKQGEAFVWSPEAEFFERIKFPAIKTFDSFASPKEGEKQELKGWAEVDLEEVRKKLATITEEAKANDPAELKKRIRELEKAQKTNPSESPLNESSRRLSKQGETKFNEERFKKEVEKMRTDFQQQMKTYFDATKKTVVTFLNETNQILSGKFKEFIVYPPPKLVMTATAKSMDISPRQFIKDIKKLSFISTNGEVDAGGQRILDMIATLNERRITVTRECIARWLGIHPNGGRFLSTLAALRGGGYLSERGYELTEKGEAIARAGETGIEEVLNAVEGTRKKIIKTIEEAGRILTREELAQLLEIHPNGGRYLSDLAWLRDMGVIPERGGIELTEGAMR